MASLNCDKEPAEAEKEQTPPIEIRDFGTTEDRSFTEENALRTMLTATLEADGSSVEKVDTDINNLHPTDTVVRGAAGAIPNFHGINKEAKDATAKESAMTVKETIHLWAPGAGWSLLFSLSLIMVGYDVLLMQSFYAQDQFTKQYGVKVTNWVEGTDDLEYGIPAKWKAGLTNAALVGEIIGLFINGILSEKYGYKKTMIGSLLLMLALIFIPFFAPNVEVLLVGQILCGVPWGVFQTIACTYASDVVPQNLRAYLCTCANLCLVLGQLIASGVLRGTLNIDNQWAYRIPFTIQWAWPLLVLPAVLFAPENPRWLVRKGRPEAARRSILQLTAADPIFDANGTLAMMQHDTAMESQKSTGTSYISCFRGVDLRRTEISCMTWLVQTLCGSSFMNFSTFFFRAAGLPGDQAFNLSIGQYAMGIVGTFVSWYLMTRFGRRPIYLWGTATLFILLILMGSLSFSNTTAGRWSLGATLLVFTFVYDATVGPVCYALVSEIPSTRLKSKTIVLARNLYNVGGILANVLTTYEITARPSGWGWGGKSAFFWAVSCGLCVLWIFLRLPEPKDRSFGEMNVLFERGVPARRFKNTTLDIFRGDHIAPSTHASRLDLTLEGEGVKEAESVIDEMASPSSDSSQP